MSEATLAARDLLRRFPLIDGHNDLPWALRERTAPVDLAEPVAGTHTDLPRLAAGGVGAQFWSVFVPASIPGDTAVTTVLEQIDLARRMIAAYPQALELALTAADVERIFAAGRLASLLGAEGGHCIASSLGVLRMLYELGVRYMTLTHNVNVGWADSATDIPAAGGLTDFGRDVVREMQRLGMLVDLSHVSVSTMNDALDIAQAPVIFSHSSARAVCDTPRNVPDEVLARLPGNGGVCMVTFVPGFVSQECADWLAGLKAEAARRGLDPKDFAQLYSIEAEWEAAHPRPQATLSQVADHVDHVRPGGRRRARRPGRRLRRHPGRHRRPGGRVDLPGALRRAPSPRLDRTRLRRPGRRQPPARPPRRRVRRVRVLAWPLRSHPMTAHAQPLPANPTLIRMAGAVRLLTWPALEASGADAAVTARDGGVSSGPYATLNLSLSVGDDPARVLENRRRLAAALGANPSDFVFARQVHGAGVRIVGPADRGSGAFTLDDAVPDTDALVTTSPDVVLAILTADCVPIVLHDPVVGVLACVHAGWRGTVALVPAAAVAAMQSLGSRPSDILAGVGPAVAPARYQVGPDVHQAVTRSFGPAAATFLRPDPAAPGRWLLDLWSATRHVLHQAGLPDPQIHTTSLPTGPADPTGPPGHGYFFSDRVARPCGRLALVARLRAPGANRGGR